MTSTSATSLPLPAEKPRFVAAMFGRIARRYDLMNTLMTAGLDAGWRRAAVQASAPGKRPRVLDVGTGTGKLARAFATTVPGSRVAGVDFALPMLRAGQRSRPANVQLASADGLRLPFADRTFDVVLSAFVVRNLADVRAGLREQLRVLRRGGRLVVLEITPGPPGLLRPLFRLYFRGVVPRVGSLVAGDAGAYTYLPESAAAFLEPERLADLLRALGGEQVQQRRLSLGAVALTVAAKG